MCGIVGLLLKRPALHERLGELMVPMLIGMTARGPDSAGMAVFGPPLPGQQRKISLYSGLTDDGAAYDWVGLVDAINAALKVHATPAIKGNHAVLRFEGPADPVKAFVKAYDAKLHLLSTGRSIELYKDIGTPAQVAERYDFAHLAGSHLVGCDMVGGLAAFVIGIERAEYNFLQKILIVCLIGIGLIGLNGCECLDLAAKRSTCFYLYRHDNLTFGKRRHVLKIPDQRISVGLVGRRCCGNKLQRSRGVKPDITARLSGARVAICQVYFFIKTGPECRLVG